MTKKLKYYSKVLLWAFLLMVVITALSIILALIQGIDFNNHIDSISWSFGPMVLIIFSSVGLEVLSDISARIDAVEEKNRK